MIKTLIFDIGGVVTKTDFKTIYANFATRIGLPSDAVKNYIDTNVEELLLGNISLDKFWEDMKSAGGNPDLDYPAIWIEEGVKNREINTELVEIIKKLKENYSVGTLTNLTPSRILLDEEMNLYSIFDYSILSCVEHLKKPNPEFYKLAIQKAEARPEESIFIDDKEKHTNAASELGMNTILYNYGENKELVDSLRGFGVKI